MTDPDSSPPAPVADGPSLVDDLLGELLPSSVDWRELVVRYPKSSVAAAALGGWVLGRSRGRDIVGALAAFAVGTVSRQVNDWIGEEIL